MTDKIILEPTEHRYTLNDKEVPGVTGILKNTGLVSFDGIRPDILEAAKKFGSAGHKMCQLWDDNDLNIDMLSAPLLPFLESWKKFKSDCKIERFDEIEKIVYSKRWNFAGQLDRVVLIKNRLTLIEIKFTTSMLPSTGIQLAGYKVAYEEMAKLKIRQRWGVQIKEKSYAITPYESNTDESIFLSSLSVYTWKIKNKLTSPSNLGGE